RRRSCVHAAPADRGTGFCAEGGGRDSFSIRMLAGAARGQDAGGANGAARSQWTDHRGIPRPTQESKKGFLSRSSRSPAIRTGAKANDWIRLHDFLRDRLTLECQQDAEKSPRLLTRGIIGRSGNTDLASRYH